LVVGYNFTVCDFLAQTVGVNAVVRQYCWVTIVQSNTAVSEDYVRVYA